MTIQFKRFWQLGWKLVKSQHGFFLVALGINSVLSFVANLSMAKVLPLHEYGLYSSQAALFNLLFIVVNAIQNTMTFLIARQAHTNGEGSIWHLFWVSFRWLGLASVALFGLSIFVAPWLASFVNAPVYIEIYLLTMLIVFLPYGITLGALQGLQHFRELGAAIAGSSLIRLLAGLLLVWLGAGLSGATLSLPLSLGLGLILNLVFLWFIHRHHKQSQKIVTTPVSAREVGIAFATHGSSTLVGTLSFAFLTSLDVVIVQHFMAGDLAGQYSVIATLGRIVLYFTQPLGMILLPRATQLFAAGKNPTQLLRRTLLGTLGLGLIAEFGLFVGGGIVAGLFASSFPADQAWMIAFYGLTMLLYSLVAVWLAFFIAVKQFLYLLLLLPGVGFQLLLFFVWHDGLLPIIISLGITGALLYLLGEVCLWQLQKRLRQPAPVNHDIATPTTVEELETV